MKEPEREIIIEEKAGDNEMFKDFIARMIAEALLEEDRAGRARKEKSA